jgi:hypothetical protein
MAMRYLIQGVSARLCATAMIDGADKLLMSFNPPGQDGMGWPAAGAAGHGLT